MAIYLKKVGDCWTVSVHQAEVRCEELARAALSALDLSEKLGLPVTLGANVPLDALRQGEQLRARIQSDRGKR